MSVIPSLVNPRDATFKANRSHHLAALRLLEERMAQARAGGGEPAMKRHSHFAHPWRTEHQSERETVVPRLQSVQSGAFAHRESGRPLSGGREVGL